METYDNARPLRIMLVDDHPLSLLGLSAIIQAVPSWQVVASVGTGTEAIAGYKEARPDVVLLDINLPDLGMVKVVARLKEIDPDVKILLHSGFDHTEEVYAGLRAGATGFIQKGAEPDEVRLATRRVAQGTGYLSAIAAASVAQRLSRPTLTAREVDVLALAAQGMSNPQIAAALFISEWTVKSHMGNILTKLEVGDRTEAVTLALRQGILKHGQRAKK